MITLSKFGVPISSGTGRGGILSCCTDPKEYVGLWVALVNNEIVCMLDLDNVKKYCTAICPDAKIIQITEENKDHLKWTNTPGGKSIRWKILRKYSR